MSQDNYSTKNRQWQQLTERNRYQIEALKKAKHTTAEIAEQIGVSKRTIERELKAGTVTQLTTQYEFVQVYCADVGQKIHESKASNKGRALKIGYNHKLVEKIEEYIAEKKYSPDAALAEIKKNGEAEVTICTSTLYHYIHNGLFLKIGDKDLVRHTDSTGKQRQKTRKVALNNTKGRSIEERSEEVLERIEEGHWEMDTVVGKGKACLLVMTERATNLELIFKLPAKKQKYVVAVINKLERKLGATKFREIFKTITCDNGCENLDQKGIEQSILSKKQRTTVYYAHPYSAYERGSNEVANVLIRRFVPKGTDIGKLTDKEVLFIQHWMNNYPRRKHKYKSSREISSYYNMVA